MIMWKAVSMTSLTQCSEELGTMDVRTQRRDAEQVVAYNK